MEDLAAFSAREVKRAAAEKREKTSIPLKKDSKGQTKKLSHPTSFLKIEEWVTFVRAKDRREKDG